MTTRAKSDFIQPRLQPKQLLTHTKPKTIKQAMATPHWQSVMQVEFDALMANKTWSLVPLPTDRKVIWCEWVFRVKENPDGSVNKFKARLVAKGFHHQQGFDFT